MNKKTVLTFAILCVIVSALWGVAPACAQQERIRITDVQVSAQIYNPRADEGPLTISGTVYELSGEREVPQPEVTAVLEGKIELPVMLSAAKTEEVSADPVMVMTEWRFSLAWDGTVPWELFPQGRFSCEITARSRGNPQLSHTHGVRFIVESD